MSHARLKNIDLYYESRGEGEPLTLIPGFASGAWTWFRQVEDLAKNFRVITFDPRGVARSPISDGKSINLKTIADDVKSLLDELEIEKAHILGASFGSFGAQEFALGAPEKLDKLVLVCTSFGGRNHVAPDLEVLTAFASVDGLNSAERIRKFMIPAFTPKFTAANRETIEKVCELRLQNGVPENVYLAQLKTATTFDAERRVSQIKAETLILTGAADSVVPPLNSRNLAKAIPNAKLEFGAGGGHMFFIERASEFNRIVADFLRKF